VDGVGFMPEPSWARGNRWLTCITLDPARVKRTPEQLRAALEAENIEARALWKPMHLQPVFAGCPSFAGGASERLFQTGLCLPSGTAMTDSGLERVWKALSEAVKS